MIKPQDLLLWVIGRICEDPWVNPTLNPVPTSDYDPVLFSVDERIIKKVRPNGVHQFSPTVGQDAFFLSVPVRMEFGDQILKGVRKLTVALNK